jgi:4-hydroxy-2-oxoheptanedioate aldolase
LRETRKGRLSTCLKLIVADPHIVEIAGMAGASSVWLCNEHTPGDWRTLEHCVRAAKLYDMDVIVRVSKGAYSDYIKPFELDASGIMVPHVESAEEARRIVDMCRFHPLGRRALDGGNVDGAYTRIPPREYVESSNREKFLILQIESPEGVAQVEEIAAVPGFDFLLFGPGDYAHRIGQVGDIRHPEVCAARRRVEEAAKRHGKMGFAVGADGNAGDLLAAGYTVTCCGGDVTALYQVFRDAVAGLAPEKNPYGNGEEFVRT